MKRKGLIPAIVVLLFILGAVVVYKSSLFTIKTIKVTGEQASCFSADGLKLQGKNLIQLDTKQLEQKIIKDNPCVRQVSISKNFPKTVEIKLTARKEIVKLAQFERTQPLDLSSLDATPSSTAALLNWNFPQDPGNYFLIDAEGMIFKQINQSVANLLFIDQPDLKVGTRLSADLFQKIDLIFSTLKEKGIMVDTGKLESPDLLLNTNPKIAFRVDTPDIDQEEVKRRLASLQLILQKAKMDEREMSTIDLRFDKPVVTYLPSKRK